MKARGFMVLVFELISEWGTRSLTRKATKGAARVVLFDLNCRGSLRRSHNGATRYGRPGRVARPRRPSCSRRKEILR
jgi:hypothetical protein